MNRLESEASNLSALLLAGLLLPQRGRTREALGHLRFGFEESLRRGLPLETTLVFYRLAAALPGGGLGRHAAKPVLRLSPAMDTPGG